LSRHYSDIPSQNLDETIFDLTLGTDTKLYSGKCFYLSCLCASIKVSNSLLGIFLEEYCALPVYS